MAKINKTEKDYEEMEKDFIAEIDDSEFDNELEKNSDWRGN